MTDVDDIEKEINARFKTKERPAPVLRRASHIETHFVRTGSRALDRALGGGVAKGRSLELFGQHQTLKTTVASMILANAQAEGMLGAWYDPEGTFEPNRAELLGVDTSELQMVDPHKELDAGEAFDVITDLLTQGNQCVIVDSVAALVPRQDAEKRIGDDNVATIARLMSRALRVWANVNRDSLIVFLNQMRTNIGVTFGPNKTTTGGGALAYYATHRVEFVRIETVKADRTRYRTKKGDAATAEVVKVPIANLIQATVEKSKVSRPYQTAIFRFDLEQGIIDPVEEVINLGLELEIIKQDGQSFIFPDANGEVTKVRFKSGLQKAMTEDHRGVAAALDREIYGG